MTYASFNSELFRQFPQLKVASDTELAYFGDDEPGPYLVFGLILRPEIERAAPSDMDYFRRLMEFVEETASADIDGFNLVQIELGEAIATLKDGELIRHTAGPNTLRAIYRGDRHWGDQSPIALLMRKLLRPRKKRNPC